MATTYNLTMENSWTKGSMTISHTTAGKVTVKVKLWRSDGGRSWNNNASKNFSITIDGTTYKHTVKEVEGTSGTSFSSSKTVSLSAAGAASVTIKVAGSLSGTTFEITGNNSKTYSITDGAKATYKVAFNANGGTGAPAAQTKTYGTTLKLNAAVPTRTGYTFQGWGTSASDTSVDYKAGANYTANAAITLYAIWKINTYTIKYNANGGTGAPASQTKTYGTTLKLSTTKPTKTSTEAEGSTTTYAFKGWSTSSTATTATYAAGANYTANANATLYAVWASSTTVNSYDVVYETDGGSDVASQVKTKGSALKLSSAVPVKNGYTFSKWNTQPDGSGTSYNPSATYSVDADLMLYAIWIPWTHTVTFNANGGSDVPSGFTKTTDIDVLISETEPTRSGYLFMGWSTESDGTGRSYNAGEAYTATQNGGTVTLYAIWTTTDILLYKKFQSCRAVEFVESVDITGFGSGGIVYAPEFIEGESMSLGANNFTFSQISEMYRPVQLLDKSNIELVDELGNYLVIYQY